MAATVYATGFKDGLGLSSSSFMAGEDYAALARAVPTQVRMAHPVRSRPMMKNVNEGKGLFAPIVVVTRNVIGKKTFNQLRGKAIALHSQVDPTFLLTVKNSIIKITPKQVLESFHLFIFIE
ncbi:protein PROTON GRADIENT REGULATION 5, chloroplastic-like [Olea europaea var. sylvestris]|uniref:PROTON GRADIENT REGULATION 5, chloroplastic n=1 Tax=Olea europaea subsp. europaea TaxID=158383 RepID=A0A8S0SGF9_OLEEU|nr:protein PROTON GRADIENT REGULATION 5, chloroplastic-like [Olea europaea var. sylvestris]CAA2990630.1 PROTON GRADIENT REGULATION 5, chloroplastic [Olea europaea subsp. europaea]